MPNAGLESSAVWRAPLPWLSRFLIWWRGGRRVHSGWSPYDDITQELAEHGVETLPFQIDIDAFWRYVEESGYRQLDYFDWGRAAVATEKWLEHFVSIELLRPQPSEVLIDIASCASPFPDIVRERFGCQTYRQDWEYPLGLNGDKIGGDASALPLPSNFADMLVMHCSFEHFEGNRDARFLREAERVLRPGGRLCILPLYTASSYLIQTDLAQWGRRLPELETDALICLAEKWGEVHGRFYDSQHFAERILKNLGGLKLQFYRVENYRDVGANCYLRFAAVFTKP